MRHDDNPSPSLRLIALYVCSRDHLAETFHVGFERATQNVRPAGARDDALREEHVSILGGIHEPDEFIAVRCDDIALRSHGSEDADPHVDVNSINALLGKRGQPPLASSFAVCTGKMAVSTRPTRSVSAGAVPLYGM